MVQYCIVGITDCKTPALKHEPAEVVLSQSQMSKFGIPDCYAMMQPKLN